MTMLRFVVVLFAAVFLVVPRATADGPWGESYFTNLEVVDQDGRRLRFYQDVLKDHQVVINFFFTSCTEICPLSTARLAMVKDMLGKRDNLRFVSISVDPENDTPERMKAYADAFMTGENWLLLTGAPENLKTIAARLGNREELKEQHRNEVVLGNAITGEWARNSAFIEPERLAYDILQLDPDWRNEKRDTSMDNVNNTLRLLPSHPGEAMFRKLCSSCHTVGVGKRVGPDLRDVHERRDEKWLVDFIVKPEKMLANKDPVALALNENFPVAVMPSLGLTQEDARDLIVYLKSASNRIRTGEDMTFDCIDPKTKQGHAH
jgi:protein SCO1